MGISEFAPPPWVINMQRYGPPPSYPHLKIPGLNAPMPDGSSFSGLFGGKDDQGKQLLNLFNALHGNFDEETQQVDKSLWGELFPQEEESNYDHNNYAETAEPRTESEIKSGISSIISGMETPDIELQKRPAKANTASSSSNINPNDTVPKPLYQVLEPTQVIHHV